MVLAIQRLESANCILRLSAHRIDANAWQNARANLIHLILHEKFCAPTAQDLLHSAISQFPVYRHRDIFIKKASVPKWEAERERVAARTRARSCRAEWASGAAPYIALLPRSPIAISPSISRDVGIATLQHFREREHAPTTKTCHGRSNYVCMDAQWHNLRCMAGLGSITNIRQPILSNGQCICDRLRCAYIIRAFNVTKFMPLSSLLFKFLSKCQTRRYSSLSKRFGYQLIAANFFKARSENTLFDRENCETLSERQGGILLR